MLLTRKLILETLRKHDSLSIFDIAKKENLGMVPDRGQLSYLLRSLTTNGLIKTLTGTEIRTYTITEKAREKADSPKDRSLTQRGNTQDAFTKTASLIIN